MADTIFDKLEKGYNSGALNNAMATVGNVSGNAIAAGRDSFVGNAITAGGNFIGDVLGKVPILGKATSGLVKGASALTGGIINAAFGNKINEQAVAGIRGAAEQLSNRQFDASNTADLLTNANFDILGAVNKNDIGKEGWFSNKVSNLAKELTALNMYANNNAAANYAGSVEKVDAMNDFNALKNQTAFGGPLMMRYTGTMSPFGNRFDTGGKIYIKPENRGKFTALKEKTGKSATWFKEHGTPAQKKMATFALNSRHWSHDDGGPLYTQGGTWDTGMTYINEGGTHEENPYEGVQVGVDPNGVPNTVEEGEVIFNDYVFSNRLKLNKGQKEYFKLGKNKEYSYADAAKKLTKEFEETPNDSISKNGRNAILQDLMMFQEEKRAKQQERKLTRQFDKMSTEEKMGLMEMANQYAQQQNQEMQQPQGELQGIPYARGGRLVNKFVTGGIEENTITPDQDKPYAASGTKTKPTNPVILQGWNSFRDMYGTPLYNNGTHDPRYTSPEFKAFVRDNWDTYGKNWWTKENAPDYFRDNTEAPSLDQLLVGGGEGKKGPLMYDETRGDAYSFGNYMFNKWIMSGGLYSKPKELTLDNSLMTLPIPRDLRIPHVPPIIGTREDKGIPTYSTAGMNAPLFGYAASIANNLFSKPDYSTADDLYSKAVKLGNINRVTAAPVSQHLRYIPTDVNRMVSQLNANTAAARRSTAEMSLNNRAQAMRQLSAINNNYIAGLSDIYTKSELENKNQLEKVATFNRDTDKVNSENALRAAMANQSSQLQGNVAAFSGIEKAIAERNRIDSERSAALSAGWTGYFQTLHDIAKQNFIMNSINRNPGYRYYYDRDGSMSYKGQND